MLSRSECAMRYHTIPERLGDLDVMGDVTTMFGEMDAAYEKLAPDYRAHGSLHEMDVPLILYNFKMALPDKSFFNANKDLAAFLWQGRP